MFDVLPLEETRTRLEAAWMAIYHLWPQASLETRAALAEIESALRPELYATVRS